jgi:hypothetical protein
MIARFLTIGKAQMLTADMALFHTDRFKRQLCCLKVGMLPDKLQLLIHLTVRAGARPRESDRPELSASAKFQSDIPLKKLLQDSSMLPMILLDTSASVVSISTFRRFMCPKSFNGKL